MEIQVEKGIELPKSARAKSRSFPELDSMKPGDSVFFESNEKQVMHCKEAAKVYNYFRKREKKITTRRVEGGFRIWRVE